eukprot:ANDGO_03556.mRNA.1 putative protein S-acyltransferase 22
MTVEQQPVRQHGFQKPFDSLQLLSWFLFGLFALHFALTVSVALASGSSVVMCTVYGVLFAVCIGTDITCAIMDPADPNVKRYVYPRRRVGKKYRSSQISQDPESVENDVPYDSHNTRTGNESTEDGQATSRVDNRDLSQMLYCYLCDSYVLQGSKHCRTCNKCVAHFDHHCRWLNSCVAKKSNYSWFFVFVCVSIVIVLYHIALCAFVIADYASTPEGQRDRIASSYSISSQSNAEAVQYFFLSTWCLFIFLGLVALYMLADLLKFHIYLFKAGLTTYEWIMRQRQLLAQSSSVASANSADGGGSVEGGDTNDNGGNMDDMASPSSSSLSLSDSRSKPHVTRTASGAHGPAGLSRTGSRSRLEAQGSQRSMQIAVAAAGQTATGQALLMNDHGLGSETQRSLGGEVDVHEPRHTMDGDADEDLCSDADEDRRYDASTLEHDPERPCHQQSSAPGVVELGNPAEESEDDDDNTARPVRRSRHHGQETLSSISDPPDSRTRARLPPLSIAARAPSSHSS